jgi:hypothetical protein
MATEKGVYATLQDAQVNLVVTRDDFKKDVTFTSVRIDPNLLRVFVMDHDMLVFTSPCEFNYEECVADHNLRVKASQMADRMQELLMEMLGGDNAKRLSDELDSIAHEGHSHSNPPQSFEDRSSNLLSQLDLPEDYLSKGTN